MENTVLSADFDFFAPKKPSNKLPQGSDGNGPDNRMQMNLNGQYKKQTNTEHLIKGKAPESYELTMKIMMETKPGQSVAVVGSLNQLGRWKDFNMGKMKWTEGHIWTITIKVTKDTPVFMYKYVKMIDGRADTWE